MKKEKKCSTICRYSLTASTEIFENIDQQKCFENNTLSYNTRIKNVTETERQLES